MTKAAADLAVAEIGSFFVGGVQAVVSGLPPRSLTLVPGSPPVDIDPNGRFVAGQMYVQFVRLTERRAAHPLLLWHGGGVTGATWETTPDGRPGWQMAFLRYGHDVYVSDAVERGRAGWSRYPEIFPGEPFFRQAREAWSLFRIGPTEGYADDELGRRPFVPQRFPHHALDALAKSFVPRWSGTEALAVAAYERLVERIGSCVIVGHSQGGQFAWQVALRRHGDVRALILLEPGGVPDFDGLDSERIANIPTLLLWGDHLETVPFWAATHRRVREACDALAAQGADVTWIDLPQRGITGNSHFLMMDDNSDEIAALVQAWMISRGLAT